MDVLDIVAYRVRVLKLQREMGKVYEDAPSDTELAREQRDQFGNAIVAIDEVLRHLDCARYAEDKGGDSGAGSNGDA